MLRALKSWLSRPADPLSRFIEDRYQAWLSVNPQIRELETLTPQGPHARFLINRMGSTGSTWLAKLLNSSPEVYCSHELVTQQTYPKRSYDTDDIQRMIGMLATEQMHGAYQAVGDVGSIYLTHLRHLRGFRTGLMLRHPARLLNTRLAVFPKDQSYTDIPEMTHTAAREVWQIDTTGLAPQDLIFIHDAFIFAAQISALDLTHLIHIEDLAEPELCAGVLKDLTDVDYPRVLIETAIANRINSRTPPKTIAELVEGFTTQQRDWYRRILGDVAPRLGYDLELDRKQ